MFQRRERWALVSVGALILVIGVVSLTRQPAPVPIDPPAVRDTLPSLLSDAEFWRTIEVFSEPNGFFRSDNFLSNESALQEVIPKLKERIRPGGVYIGVGPEQNFTYILAFQPKISFVVDIRRLNMLEHLIYKAIFELSGDRSDFVSYLFSRPRPKGLTENTDIEEMFDAYESSPADQSFLENNANAILLHLVETHQFGLSEDDQLQIRYILSNFQQAGPDLSYTFLGSSYQGTLGMPTYRELMQDSDEEGFNWSFLANKEQFRRIQDIQRRNLIIPLVGDFAGPRALRAVGRFMTQHHAVLSVFYTSNVEMYLFQQGDDWKRFYENVATLPFNSASAFIRFAAGRGGRARSQVWSSVREVVDSIRARRVDDHSGVLRLSR